MREEQQQKAASTMGKQLVAVEKKERKNAAFHSVCNELLYHDFEIPIVSFK